MPLTIQDTRTLNPAIATKMQALIAAAQAQVATDRATLATDQAALDTTIRAYNLALSGRVKDGLVMNGYSGANADSFIATGTDPTP